MPLPGNITSLANSQSTLSAAVPPSVNQVPPVPTPSQAAIPFGVAGAFAGPGTFPSVPLQSQPNTEAPPSIPPPINGITEEQLNLLRMLQAQGLPQEQLAAVIQALFQGAGPAPPPSNTNSFGQQSAWQANQGYGVGNTTQSRDFGGVRSPVGRFGKRSRSRSPVNHDRRRNASPRRRRDSPVYGDYDADSHRDGSRNEGGRYGRGRVQANGFGRGSPARQRGSASPPRGQNNELPPPGPRYIEHESALEPDRIRGKW